MHIPTSIMTKIIDLKSAFKLFKKRKADFLCPVTKPIIFFKILY